MRNLVLKDYTHHSLDARNCCHLTCDNLNEVLFTVSDNNIIGFSPKLNQTVHCISLDDVISDATSPVVCLHYLPDHEELCVITACGDCIMWREGVGCEVMGCIEAGITCAQWSPDNQLVVLTTGAGMYLVMTYEFDPVAENPIESSAFGEEEQVTVGWGKKETQFHGTEGKQAATQRAKKERNTAEWDSGSASITWRGDAQIFAVNSVHNGDRYLRIYNRDGILQATNEPVVSMGSCVAWRPTGNLIACSQRKPNKHDIIFFEKNGLQRGEFSLPFLHNQKKIVHLRWNMESDILLILLTDTETTNNYSVQLWTTGNYHWYLKQEMVLLDQQQPPSVLWDEENPYKLHVIHSDGNYSEHVYTKRVNQSVGANNNSLVGVIDGARLLFTPFATMVLPPPMAAHTVALSSPVNLFAYGVGESKHDVVVYTSTGQFFYVKQFERQSLEVCGEHIIYNPRHMAWFEKNTLAVVNGVNHVLLATIEDNKLNFIYRLDVDLKINSLFKSGENELFVVKEGGLVTRLSHKEGELQEDTQVCSLPMECTDYAATSHNQRTLVFGLTQQHRLFLNDTEIANNCTSMLIHEDFLLLTTHSHTLRCIYLDSLASSSQNAVSFDEASRRVERGSRLVTANRTSVVFQMPRGNLECIHPRCLVVTQLKALLSNLEYNEAMQIMRKHRINLNLFYDHKPQLFLENVGKFLSDMKYVNHINLFLADLMAEDVCTTLYHSFYYHGGNNTTQKQSSEKKVDLVCGRVREVILQQNYKNLELALLTTYARQKDLESVLLKIKEIKDNPPADADAVNHDAALKYILYLVDVNALFDIALGLYDFNLVVMVAEKSQKDPKEYLPFLKKFKEMEVDYMEYSIDKYLKRNLKALHSLVKCEDRFNECVEFVTEHRLYREALKLYPNSSQQYREISNCYGEYLFKKKNYEEAAIVYSRCGCHKEALDCLLKTNQWSMALSQAKLLKYSSQETSTLCRRISDQLKSERLFSDAAYILEVYLQDLEESVVCLLAGHLWFKALHLIHKSEREDLIETNLKPCMYECFETVSTKIEELSTNFDKHTARLRIVKEKKDTEQCEIAGGARDDLDNDLYSDTSSITGRSAVTSKSGRTSSTGHSSKSRKKTNRKKYSLREGSKHEDYALREVLAEIARTSDSIKEEVGDLLKILSYYFEEEKAFIIQTSFANLLQNIESKTKEIWSDQTNPSIQEDSFSFGPNATVETIIAQKDKSRTSGANNETPISIAPNLRKNVHWKNHLLTS